MSKLQEILDNILAEAEVATNGPWEQHENVDNKLTVFAHETSIAETHRCNLLNNQKLVNATFIAHSRTNVPRMAKALKMAINFLRHDKVFRFATDDEVIARITDILKGE